jgi:conjugal transfer pilin signal peptidase TrbI
MSSAKPRSQTGEPLVLGPTGVIPANHFYVYAPHKDSLDSRFALTGWIPLERVSGRAIPLF